MICKQWSEKSCYFMATITIIICYCFHENKQDVLTGKTLVTFLRNFFLKLPIESTLTSIWRHQHTTIVVCYNTICNKGCHWFHEASIKFTIQIDCLLYRTSHDQHLFVLLMYMYHKASTIKQMFYCMVVCWS